LAGYFKDASVSNTKTKVVHLGAQLDHRRGWISSFAVEGVDPGPAGAGGALSQERRDADAGAAFPHAPAVAAQLIHQTHDRLCSHRKIRVKTDGQYATQGSRRGACFEVGGVLDLTPAQRLGLVRPSAQTPQRQGRPNQTPWPPPLHAASDVQKRQKGGGPSIVTLGGKKVRRRIKSLVCLWWHVAKEHPIKVVIVKNPTVKDATSSLQLPIRP